MYIQYMRMYSFKEQLHALAVTKAAFDCQGLLSREKEKLIVDS